MLVCKHVIERMHQAGVSGFVATCVGTELVSLNSNLQVWTVNSFNITPDFGDAIDGLQLWGPRDDRVVFS